jgi:hypothetical protein
MQWSFPEIELKLFCFKFNARQLVCVLPILELYSFFHCIFFSRLKASTMAKDSQNMPPVFSINVTPEGVDPVQTDNGVSTEVVELLQQLVLGQERQNELLEDLVENLSASQRQRASELGQWKRANPHLARRCRVAAEALGQIQTEFLENLTHEIDESVDAFADGGFMLNEFVDRYGPRLAHLNGVLQVLSQLSATDQPATSR